MIVEWVVTDGGCNEVARNHFGALMNQLVKSVLAVGSRLAPNYRPCVVMNLSPGTIYRFAIALHVPLLEVSGKPMKILIIRKNGLAGGVIKVYVPNAEQSENDGDIFFQRLAFKMIIDGVGPFK